MVDQDVLDTLNRRLDDQNDLLEFAWGIIANAGGGNWTLETLDWQSAADQFRTRYFRDYPRPKPPETPPQEPQIFGSPERGPDDDGQAPAEVKP